MELLEEIVVDAEELKTMLAECKICESRECSCDEEVDEYRDNQD